MLNVNHIFLKRLQRCFINNELLINVIKQYYIKLLNLQILIRDKRFDIMKIAERLIFYSDDHVQILAAKVSLYNFVCISLLPFYLPRKCIANKIICYYCCNLILPFS